MKALFRFLFNLGNLGRSYRTEFLATCFAFFISFLLALMGKLTQVLNPWADLSVPITILASILTFSLWLLATDTCFSYVAMRYVKYRNKEPKVAIIFVKGLTEDSFRQASRATEFTPDHLDKRLKERKMVTEFILPSAIDERYPMIINPFGELYPEEDVSNMTVLKSIMRYIKMGGVFVNIAGLPFFYMRDFKNNIEDITGPMLQYYIGGKPSQLSKAKGLLDTYQPVTMLEPSVTDAGSSLVNTWLYKNLGIRTTLTSARLVKVRTVEDSYFKKLIPNKEEVEVQEFRSAIRCEITNAKLIPILVAKLTHRVTGQPRAFYPIAAVKYGVGYLIMVGMALEKKREQDLTIVIDTLKRIQEKLGQRGSLD